MAAFLGFSHKLREVPSNSTLADHHTHLANHGTYTENEIYQHITNCQVFLAYNTDETKWMARRQAFQKSVSFLVELTRQGTIWEAGQLLGLSKMLFGKEEANPMHDLGVFVARQVLKYEPDKVRAAGILLLISLDFAYNAVVSVSCDPIPIAHHSKCLSSNQCFLLLLVHRHSRWLHDRSHRLRQQRQNRTGASVAGSSVRCSSR